MSYTFRNFDTKKFSRILAPAVSVHSTRMKRSYTYHNFFVPSLNYSLQSLERFSQNDDVSCKRDPSEYGGEIPRDFLAVSLFYYQNACV